MKRRLIITEDGSSSIYTEEFGENYHSGFGAINESMHIFISCGLDYIKKKAIRILEVGFGTGLNAYLTLHRSIERDISIHYLGIEKYPLHKAEWESLNYTDIIPQSNPGEFELLHSSEWEEWSSINNFFNLLKTCQALEDFQTPLKFDLVYFDAFSPDIQPELWTLDIFRKIYNSMNAEGLLLTYTSKGQVKRNLTEVGFRIERIEGPKGKRHILRAFK